MHTLNNEAQSVRLKCTYQPTTIYVGSVASAWLYGFVLFIELHEKTLDVTYVTRVREIMLLRNFITLL